LSNFQIKNLQLYRKKKMKKILLTTAMASVFTTVAIAQTTITGELRVSYSDISATKGMGTATSSTTKDTSYGFGTEQQINVQNKGKLPVGGLDYAAGFAIENDGDQATTLFNENTYIDLINASSGTTISFGRDHIQRSDSDYSATNLVGFSPNELSQTSNVTNENTRFKQNIGAAPGQQFGVAILQKLGTFGTASYNFVPNNKGVTAGALSDTSGNTAGTGSSEAINPNTTAAYEVGFLGSLGVQGLTVHAFKNQNHDFVTATNTIKAGAKNIGVKYNFGQVTAGLNKKTHQAEATSGAEITEKAAAVAFAVDKNFTIGLLYAKAELEGNAIDQKIKALNLGYSLGPIDLSAGYGKNKDQNSVSGANSDHYIARMITRF
jgi:hypothetical protein